MRINKTLDRILSLVLIIALIFLVIGWINQIIIQHKVIKQDNCIEVNRHYYCEVK